MGYIETLPLFSMIFFSFIILFAVLFALYRYKNRSSKNFIPFPQKYDLRDIDIYKIDLMLDGFDF